MSKEIFTNQIVEKYQHCSYEETVIYLGLYYKLMRFCSDNNFLSFLIKTKHYYTIRIEGNLANNIATHTKEIRHKIYLEILNMLDKEIKNERSIRASEQQR